jgi:hypothetical protein
VCSCSWTREKLGCVGQAAKWRAGGRRRAGRLRLRGCMRGRCFQQLRALMARIRRKQMGGSSHNKSSTVVYRRGTLTSQVVKFGAIVALVLFPRSARLALATTSPTIRASPQRERIHSASFNEIVVTHMHTSFCLSLHIQGRARSPVGCPINMTAASK